MFKKLLSIILAKDNSAAVRARAHREAIHEEARVGGTLFGPVAKGSRREFFCLDEHTWVWHEEWTDANGMRQVRTTRYDVRPQGILKAQDGTAYQPISREEAERLIYAINRYNQLLDTEFAPYLGTTASAA